jgi:hypothetical protein
LRPDASRTVFFFALEEVAILEGSAGGKPKSISPTHNARPLAP